MTRRGRRAALGPDARRTRSTSPASAARSPATRWRWPRSGPRCRPACARRTSRSPIPLAERFTAGVAGVIAAHGLPWHVQRLGCRAEYWFCPPPRDGAAAAAAVDEELEGFLHLWCAQPRRAADAVPQHGAVLPRTTPRPTSTGTPRSSPKPSPPSPPDPGHAAAPRGTGGPRSTGTTPAAIRRPPEAEPGQGGGPWLGLAPVSEERADGLVGPPPCSGVAAGGHHETQNGPGPRRSGAEL